MVALIAVVMIVAYVARRAQTVGLPPGVAKDPPAEVSPPAPPSVSFTSSHDAATEPDQPALSSQLGGTCRQSRQHQETVVATRSIIRWRETRPQII